MWNVKVSSELSKRRDEDLGLGGGERGETGSVTDRALSRSTPSPRQNRAPAPGGRPKHSSSAAARQIRRSEWEKESSIWTAALGEPMMTVGWISLVIQLYEALSRHLVPPGTQKIRRLRVISESAHPKSAFLRVTNESRALQRQSAWSCVLNQPPRSVETPQQCLCYFQPSRGEGPMAPSTWTAASRCQRRVSLANSRFLPITKMRKDRTTELNCSTRFHQESNSICGSEPVDREVRQPEEEEERNVGDWNRLFNTNSGKTATWSERLSTCGGVFLHFCCWCCLRQPQQEPVTSLSPALPCPRHSFYFPRPRPPRSRALSRVFPLPFPLTSAPPPQLVRPSQPNQSSSSFSSARPNRGRTMRKFSRYKTQLKDPRPSPRLVPLPRAPPTSSNSPALRASADNPTNHKLTPPFSQLPPFPRPHARDWQCYNFFSVISGGQTTSAYQHRCYSEDDKLTPRHRSPEPRQLPSSPSARSKIAGLPPRCPRTDGPTEPKQLDQLARALHSAAPFYIN